MKMFGKLFLSSCAARSTLTTTAMGFTIRWPTGQNRRRQRRTSSFGPKSGMKSAKAASRLAIAEYTVANVELAVASSTKVSGLGKDEMRLPLTQPDFVRITPIISRHNGMDMVEAGAGGGHGDMNQQHELEIDDANVFKELMALCVEKLHGQPKLLSGVVQMLTDATSKGGSAISLELADLSIEAGTHTAAHGADEDDFEDVEDLPLEKLVSLLAKRVTKLNSGAITTRANTALQTQNGPPKQITFPYSRHASYGELCVLVEAFIPRNIYPCTVDKSNWGPEHTMSYLFGHLYTTPQKFGHDTLMLQQYKGEDGDNIEDEQTQQTQQTQFEDMETQLSGFDSQAPTPRSTTAVQQPSKHRRDDTGDAPTEAKRRRRSSPNVRDWKAVQQLYIGRFPYEAEKRHVLQFFKNFDVVEVHIPSFNWNRRHSTGYAFVDVANIAEASRAMRELDGTYLLDSIVHIELVKDGRSQQHGIVNTRSQRRPRAASPDDSNEHTHARWTEPAPGLQSVLETTDQRDLWQRRIATSLEARSSEKPSSDAPIAGKSTMSP